MPQEDAVVNLVSLKEVEVLFLHQQRTVVDYDFVLSHQRTTPRPFLEDPRPDMGLDCDFFGDDRLGILARAGRLSAVSLPTLMMILRMRSASLKHFETIAELRYPPFRCRHPDCIDHLRFACMHLFAYPIVIPSVSWKYGVARCQTQDQ